MVVVEPPVSVAVKATVLATRGNRDGRGRRGNRDDWSWDDRNGGRCGEILIFKRFGAYGYGSGSRERNGGVIKAVGIDAADGVIAAGDAVHFPNGYVVCAALNEILKLLGGDHIHGDRGGRDRDADVRRRVGTGRCRIRVGRARGSTGARDSCAGGGRAAGSQAERGDKQSKQEKAIHRASLLVLVDFQLILVGFNPEPQI